MQTALPYINPQGGVSREERWEARRRLRDGSANPQLGQQTFMQPDPAPVYPPQQAVYPPQQASFPPQQASFASQQSSYPPQQASYPPQQASYSPQQASYPPQQSSYPPAYPQIQTQPAQDALQEIAPPRTFEQFQSSPIIPPKQPEAKPPPPDNSFFTNPISDGEVRRRQLQAEYRTSIQEQPRQVRQVTPDEGGYIPSMRGRQQSRSQIKMIDQSKKQYQDELKQQMELKKMIKQKEKSASPEVAYFPFGKPGAGAPYRDTSGNIVAVRPPHYNENDPRFMQANRLQIAADSEKIRSGLVAQTMQQIHTSPHQSFSKVPSQYQVPQYPPQPPQYAQQYPPQYPDQYDRPPPQYAPQYPPQMPPDYMPQTQMPAQYSSQSYLQDQILATQQAPVQFEQSIVPTQVVDTTVELERLTKQHQKLELGRALQEQMEERKRLKEEERRQRILEERMEEARLEKQRRQLEEEQQREADKRKKQLLDLQMANDHNVMVASQPKRGRRGRTPYEITTVEAPQSPPREPPRGPQPTVTTVERVTEVPIEVGQKMQSAFDNELWRMKNEMNYQQNELKDAVLRLRNEAQNANEQRLEAMRQIDQMKEGMRQRQLEEDIRSRELYNIMSNAGPAKFDLISRMPKDNALPLALPRGKDWAELSLDGTKSLKGDSKFVPLGGGPPEPFILRPLSKDRRAVELDSLFPSLPDGGPANMTLRDANHTAMTSLGVDNIAKRNDERLRILERMDGNAGDELAKLDELLFNFLDKDEKSRMTPLASIKEADADASLSLPRSAAYSVKSDSISFY